MPIPSHTNFGWVRDPTPEEEKKKNPLKYSFRAVTPYAFLAKIRHFNLLDDPTTAPPVYDQGQIGSCTANASLVAYQVEANKQPQNTTKQQDASCSSDLSRLFLYYNSRLREGTVDSDSGAMIPDVMDSLQQDGVCDEALHPYDVSRFTFPPSEEAKTEALNHTVVDCSPVNQNADEIKQTLLNGHLVIFGFLVFPSMMSPVVARTGCVPLPSPREQPVGGHCVAICGWDDFANGGSFLV